MIHSAESRRAVEDQSVTLTVNRFPTILLPTPGIELAALLTPHLRLKRLRAPHLRLITHPDITQVSAREIFETDASFHELLAEASGNRFVLQAVQQQNPLRQLREFGSDQLAS